MTLEHATHTTYKITRFDSEEWLNYNKKERSKPLKNEPNCLKPALFAYYCIAHCSTALAHNIQAHSCTAHRTLQSCHRALYHQVSPTDFCMIRF